MSTFIDDVRNDRIGPPTSKKFDPAIWSEVKNDTTRDVSDRQFAQAGLFFFAQLNEARRRFDAFTSFAQSPRESIRLVTGFQNYSFRKLQNSTEARLANLNDHGPAYLESLMSAEIQDDVQGTVSVDDSLAVDATSLIIRTLLSAQISQNEPGLEISDSEVETQVKEVFRLGKIYSYLEELWSECQWADALFDPNTPPVLRLRQSDWGKRSAISEYKIHSIQIEQTFIAVQRWKDATHQSPTDIWMKPEITLRESEGLLHPEVKDAPLLPGEVPMDVIHAQVYQRFYNDNLLTRQIPESENLTITDLLIGRRILAALGNALQARLTADFSLPAKELFLFAAPLISFNSLRKALHTALRHLSTKAITALLSSFIFGGKTLDLRNLWFRPFVRVGEDHLIALAQPLIGLNLELVIDEWSSRGKLYGEKGLEYEGRLRREMAAVAESGPIRSAQVHKAPIKRLKTCKDACGDIDLLIKVGRTILVGEVKTLRFPVRALGVYNNISEISDACGQAARKAKAVAESIVEVLQITGFRSDADKELWKVLPFVVSNQAIGVGSSFDGIAIVDRQILDSYLGQGGYYPAARLGPGGVIINKGQFHPYYDNDLEAEERVEDYLRNPPSVCRYEHFCELHRLPFEPLDNLIVVESVRMNLSKLNATLPEAPA